MDSYSGKDLLKTFHNLGINLGNLSPEVIEAFFDTNCPDTIHFLSWLCQLSEENVVSALEIEQYEQLSKGGLILKDDQYKNALQEVVQKYPDILDVEGNAFEIECIEDAVAALLDEEKVLEHVISANEKLDKRLSKALTAAINEEIQSNIRKDKAEEKCLTLSQMLDELNCKLYEQITKCSDKLVEFEYATKPSYISHMPMDLYNCHYNNILCNLNMIMKIEYNTLPKLESAVKSCKKVNKSVFDADILDTLLELKERLFKSVQNKNYKEVTERKLAAEIKYLQDLNVCGLITMCATNSSLKLQLEGNISYRDSRIDRAMLELETAARQASEKYVNLPKLHVAQKEIRTGEAKLKHLETVDAKFSEIFSYHTLLYLMFASNNSDIKYADKFFRSVHYYITHNLHKCQLRIEAMTNQINIHNLRRDLPFEQSSPLLKAFTYVLSGNEAEDATKSVMEMFNKFENKKRTLDVQLFCNEIYEHRRLCKEMENSSKLLKSFLQSGPTVECVVVPYDLYKTFEDVSKVMESQKTACAAAAQILNNASKNLAENKWLRTKRQLWIHFMMQPKRVLSSIKEIEDEVRRIRNE